MITKTIFRRSLIFLLFLTVTNFISCGKKDNPPIVPIEQVTNTFTNPLVNGADPWVYQKDGLYYYLHTVGNAIRLWKTDAISKLASASSQLVFSPIPGSQNSSNVWAPEIFFLDNKWYIYYTAGNGTDISQRTWVLENSNADPTTGTWVDKGKIYNANADFWAIDGTVMEYNGQRYFIWCGRPDVTNTDLTQKIYISKMANPWTLEGNVILLSQPDFDWEKRGFAVNEAPQVLQGPDNRYFLTYSASFCGTDDYALGLLALKAGGNPLVAADWTKKTQPVFSKSPQNNAFGPGHNSFFKSPDNTENWIIYHANSATGQGCSDKRNIRIQKFTFNTDGTPNFGEPVATGLKINKPSGEK